MGKKDATKREKSAATKAAPVDTAVTPAKPASVLKPVTLPVPTKSLPTLLYMLATRASFEHKVSCQYRLSNKPAKNPSTDTA